MVIIFSITHAVYDKIKSTHVGNKFRTGVNKISDENSAS